MTTGFPSAALRTPEVISNEAAGVTVDTKVTFHHKALPVRRLRLFRHREDRKQWELQ